jgi:hypothetical protein
VDSVLALALGCNVQINNSYAIVPPPATGSTRAVDFYSAIAKAHESGSASPYRIYLCDGTFPLDETVVLHANIKFYGRGVDFTTIRQSGNPNVMGVHPEWQRTGRIS